MLKLIRADLYRIFHRPFFYCLLCGMAVLAFFVNFSLAHVSSSNTVTSSWMVILVYFLSWPVLLMPLLIDLVGAEEYKEHTLKNSVSYGFNRMKLYSSQLIVSTILGVIVGAVALGAYCGGSVLFLKQDVSFTAAFASDFFQRIGVSFIGYVAAIPIAAFLAVILQKNSLFVFAFYAFMFMPQYILKLIRMPQLSNYLLMTQFGRISTGSVEQMMSSCFVFLGTGILFSILGILFFRKKDIC